MKINVKDDVTITGTVIDVDDDENFVLIRTAKNNEYLICIEDIKTIRPEGNNGGGVRSIVKEGEDGTSNN